MSATPEQIAERLEQLAQNEAECGFMTEAYDIRQAAALIRAQAEEIRQLKIGLEVAEKLYRETLGIKGGGFG